MCGIGNQKQREMDMDIRRTGIILNAENFEQCVAFYRRAFDLPVLFEQTDGDFRLRCLAFGGA